MKKGEIVWLHNHYCKHGHNYLEHYTCYEKDHPDKIEKVGFLDIEATNLEANFGFMLTYCIKDGNSNQILSGTINQEDIKKYPVDKPDKGLVEKCVTDMLKFDRIVAHYGRKFDLPFIRTRALIDGVKFPPYKSLAFDDTWRWAKDKLKLNSNRLETVCQTIFGETNKTHIEYKYWVGGSRGDKKSLNYILDHNKKDVIDLERVWRALRDYVNITESSI